MSLLGDRYLLHSRPGYGDRLIKGTETAVGYRWELPDGSVLVQAAAADPSMRKPTYTRHSYGATGLDYHRVKADWEALGLAPMAASRLAHCEVDTPEQAAALTDDQLLSIRYFGVKFLVQLRTVAPYVGPQS